MRHWDGDSLSCAASHAAGLYLVGLRAGGFSRDGPRRGHNCFPTDVSAAHRRPAGRRSRTDPRLHNGQRQKRTSGDRGWRCGDDGLTSSHSRRTYTFSMAAASKTRVEVPEPAGTPADTPARGQQPEQTLPDYVVITPARNEAASLELTIGSMLAQTVLPLRWVIVSDGSTDGTDDIVTRYARQYPWIELIHLPARSERDFAAKVRAFNAGLERVSAMRYDVVVSLDADITFDP